MRPLDKITMGFVVIALSTLPGCIVAPYPGGRSEVGRDGYGHDQRDHRGDQRDEGRGDRGGDRRD
jgi:hypothetical protein